MGRLSGVREARTTMSDEVQAERIEQLIGALRDDNEALRDHAIASLSQVGEDAVGPLIGLMADEDVLIREAATSAIVRIGPSVVDPLIEALEDAEWTIREQPASGLGKLKDPRGVVPLVKALKDKDGAVDRKSTRLNSSHGYISYAV